MVTGTRVRTDMVDVKNSTSTHAAHCLQNSHLASERSDLAIRYPYILSACGIPIRGEGRLN